MSHLIPSQCVEAWGILAGTVDLLGNWVLSLPFLGVILPYKNAASCSKFFYFSSLGAASQLQTKIFGSVEMKMR